MRELSLKEIQQVLLNIAKAFDTVCTKNNIPYYMLGGTMLGAIRHKGFIPWDDDMDFGVPVEYYDKLETLLEQELPSNLRCSTYKNSKSVFLPFYKIEDTTTVLDDLQLPNPLNEKIGINIDIFPLYRTNIEDKNIDSARKWSAIGSKIYTDSRTESVLTGLIKKVLRIVSPFNKVWFCNRSVNTASKIKSGQYLSNIWGRWQLKEHCPIGWYGENVRYSFEDTAFCGLKEYDAYLSQMYGEYMTPPSKTQQFTHSDKAFKK